MPVSGPRKLYELPQIEVGEAANGEGGESIIVKMKEPIAKWFGLTPIPYDSPLMRGNFGGTGTNAGYEYVRQIGGYRFESYTIVANTSFLVTERIKLPLGFGAPFIKTYRTLTIGLPKGGSVHEFIDWLASTAKIGKISKLVTPRGRSIGLSADTYSDGEGGGIGEGGELPAEGGTGE